MGLVAAESQRKTDVAKILGDVVVKCFGLFQIGVQAFGQFFRLRTNFRRRHAAIFFEIGVPATELLPAFESGQLNVGALLVSTALFLLLFFLLLITIRVWFWVLAVSV